MKRNIMVLLSFLALLFVLTGCSMLIDTETPTPEATLTELPDTVATSTGIMPPAGVDNYIDSYYATSVQVTDPTGTSYSDDGSGDLLEMLLKMTKNAERTVYLSYAVDASKYYKAVFDGPAGPVTYKFYFSLSPDECFFESGSGRFYRSNKEGCLEFFNSQYSEAAYSSAVYPSFSVGSKKVSPTAIEWKYKRHDGTYKTPDQPPALSSAAVDIGTVAANIKFAFSIEPTSVTVSVVKENGEVIFDGNYSQLANISLKGDVDVTINVYAKWDESDDTICTGNATYSLKAKLGPSAVFSIDRTKAKPGEFLVLTCPNTSVDLKQIKITMDPEIDFTPSFFSDGTQLKALLPIPLTINVKNGITYTVTAYGSTQKFHVAVEQRKNASSVSISMIPKDVLESVGVTADPYKKIYSDIQADIKQYTTFSRIYKQEGFILGYDETLRAKFGDSIKYSTLGSTLFTAHDYSWVGTRYDDVLAVSDGKVVFVGEHEYTGGLVVVDHGMGLLSWYWNLSLSSVEVYVGDEVKQGDVIGNNGGGGLAEVYNSTNISVHIGLTVFDVPVDIGQLLS